MAALTAASWTVTITGTRIQNRNRTVQGTMEIPGTDTYPTGGIPLPTIDKLGMYRNLDSLVLTGHDSLTKSAHTSWDKTNHKLQLYGDLATGADDALSQVPNTHVPGPRVWRFVASGW